MRWRRIFVAVVIGAISLVVGEPAQAAPSHRSAEIGAPRIDHFFCYPCEGKAAQTRFRFSAGARGSDGGPVWWHFDFGDGHTYTRDAPETLATANHVYGRGGTFRVEVTVTDSTGAKAVASVSVTVEPPVLADLAVAFPGHGTWLASTVGGSTSWRELHGLDFGPLATGDLDANGTADLLADVPGSGTWVRYDDGAWLNLTALQAKGIVSGDLDGNGQGDAVFDFGVFGLWGWINNSSWLSLLDEGQERRAMGVVDVEKDGRAEVFVALPGSGLWVRYGGGSWRHWATVEAKRLLVSSKFGWGDAVVDLGPGQGLAIVKNTDWQSGRTVVPLHPLDPGPMVLGDIDADGESELIVAFPGRGLYTWDAGAWRCLHFLDASGLTTGDLDGNGQDDVVIGFGAAGTWIWMNDATWVPLTGLGVGHMATGPLIPR